MPAPPSPPWVGRAMKLRDMSKGAEKPKKAPVPKRKTDAAFDVWLERGLHQMFDDVAREPVPDDLLKLIQQDRENK